MEKTISKIEELKKALARAKPTGASWYFENYQIRDLHENLIADLAENTSQDIDGHFIFLLVESAPTLLACAELVAEIAQRTSANSEHATFEEARARTLIADLKEGTE